MPEPLQDGLKRQQVLRPVVDQEDLRGAGLVYADLDLSLRVVRDLLHEDTTEVMIDDWLTANRSAFMVAEPTQEGELAQFGLGDALLRVYSLLDGRTRLGDLSAKVRSPEARLNLLRLTYLLVQTDHARLS